ncbi:cysteine hydrolase family protein [Ornithinimicrobium tianjinense]|uniref:Nicotinamidase n=1 Tax=Ornithinimicrobium tianjinense TaxID=1195761 RepID=A0A917F7Y7_9MICO|nr:isochorismatase family cysteine hydrolase [Ornithinimicrobium tianjinense]GGF56716.1 nicotinamidase [Ornithinimicrobium tianjinense]
MTSAPWLVIVDAQRVFADPSSPWCAPRFPEIVAPLRELVEEHREDERIVQTRWIPPHVKHGSWVPYFLQYSWADKEPHDPLFDLVDEIEELQLPHTVSEPTFGKWGEQLRGIVGYDAHLVLTGVATDCCVLSTALAAADAGCTVEVVAAACAGSSDEAHGRALEAMKLYAPQITVR